ncbi:hypothetical protein Scep_002224 [Stephania cephalantha]|uniref:Uncharacterized protein n=1 Tax=Stephania cephalantha TaxID=152367 RepID=A0AAP0Q4S2_9MAGN
MMTAATVSGSTGEGRRASIASAARTAVHGAATGHQRMDAREIVNEQQRLRGGLNSGVDGWTATRLQQRHRREAVTLVRRSGGGSGSGSDAVNDVEQRQRRGGALPDRSIPDETQQ